MQAMLHNVQTKNTSCSSAGDVVINDCLYILFRLQFSPGRIVARHSFGINVDDLPISFVFEQQALLVLSNHLKHQATFT